jgi:hypothetical protein
VCENDGFAVGQVRCDDGHGDSKIFKTLRFENLLNEVTQPVVAGKAKAGDTPSSDVSEAKCAASGNNPCERRAAGISGAQDAANARASDKGNGYVILFKNLQDAEMSESTSETAAQREANTCPFERVRWPSVQ